jgi:hypothetical protein
MRYRFWTDLPRNVSQREYDRYHGKLFGGIMAGLVGTMMLVGSFAGLFSADVEELARHRSMTVAEMADWSSPRNGPFKVAGMLSARKPAVVPGETQRPVLHGRLNVRVDAHRIRGGTRGPQRELIDWKGTAEELVLTDGRRSIPIAVDPRSLPLKEDRSAKGRVRYEGNGGRRRPVAAEFDGLAFPLDGDDWKDWTDGGSAISVAVDLHVVPDRQTVTVVADVDASDGAPRLIARSTADVQIHFGTEADVNRRTGTMQVVLLLLGCGLVVVGWRLVGAARMQRAEFVRRSNE